MHSFVKPPVIADSRLTNLESIRVHSRSFPASFFLHGFRWTMNLSERESLDKLCETAIGAAYEVANQLGSGFLEKV